MPIERNKYPLELRGGVWGAVFILLVALTFLALASVNKSKIDGYVVAFLIPVMVAVFLARDWEQYGKAVVSGLSKPMFSIIALAVLFASVASQLISESGLIQAVTYWATLGGMTGGNFVVVTFLLSCIVSFSTGTSVGTYFVVIPILFPAGVSVGADPAFLIGSVAAGGAFGDNLAPISDTTIASATTQEVDVGGVVKSRMKYSIPVALAALIIYLVTSPRGEAAGAPEVQSGDTLALVMLIVPVAIITLCLMGVHLVSALAVGSTLGVAVGLLAGLFAPTELLNFPGPFQIGGLLPASIEAALPTIAFLLVVFPFLGIMEASGALERLGHGLGKLAKGPRSVETVTVLATGGLSMMTGVISVAILSVGEVVKNLGVKFNIEGYRRANLMDCSGVAFCFMVPWTVHAIVPTMLAAANHPRSHSLVSPMDVPLHNFYCWMMLAMLVFSIASGYGRKKSA